MNTIDKLIKCMYEYQLTYDIKNKCMINTVILADHMKALNIPHKIVTGFVMCNMKIKDGNLITKQIVEEDKNEIVPAINVHCWIVCTDKIIDPSWDMHSKKDAIYYNTISDLMKTDIWKAHLQLCPQSH